MIAEIVQALRPRKYEFVKELTYGTFRDAYHFRDGQKRDWAVKWIAKNDQQCKIVYTQLKDIKHPNIVAIHDVLRIPKPEGDIYIVIMEYYDAGTLKEHRWDFTARELLSTMKGVLEGLLCMYNNNIVHRNINPDNILLKYENGVRVAKLCDFGTSRTCGQEDLLSTVVGLEQYRAPESEIGEYDEGVDIWAFGVVLYETITGESPFPDSQAYKIAATNGFNILPRVFEDIFRPNASRSTAKELLQVFGKGFTDEEYRHIEAVRENARKKYKPNNPPAAQRNIIDNRQSRQEPPHVKHQTQEMSFGQPQKNVLVITAAQPLGTKTPPIRIRGTSNLGQHQQASQPRPFAKIYDVVDNAEVSSSVARQSEQIQPAMIHSQKVPEASELNDLIRRNRKLQKDLEIALGANKELKADLQQHRGRYKLEAERLREVANDRHNDQQLKASQQENQRLHQQVQDLKLELHRRQLSSQQLASNLQAESQRQQKMFDDQIQELRTLLVDSIRKCQNIVKEWMYDRREHEEKLRISQKRHIEIGKREDQRILNSSTDWAFNVREAEKEKVFLKLEIDYLIKQKADLIKQRDDLKEQLAKHTQKSTEESVKFEQLHSKHDELQRKFKAQQSENRQSRTIANRQSQLARVNQQMMKKIYSLTAELEQRTKQFFKLEDEKEKLLKQVDILTKTKRQ